MVTASELLSIYQHEHDVVDSDTYFVIDPVTRKMQTAVRSKNVIMQYDHDSERFTFELPRYVEGHDMMLCNAVLVHWNNIDGTTGEETAEATDIYDLQINPDNEETVICSWLISRNSTQRVGILSFLVQYKCVAEDGTATYEWHTDIYEDIEIRKSRNNGPQSIIEYTDILEQWRAKLFGAGDTAIANINATAESQLTAIMDEGVAQLTTITSEAATQKADIEAKGAATLATIPDEYTELYNLANSAERTKSDAITCEAEGSVIIVNNSSDDYVRGLKIYGKSTQVTTTGKNLLDDSKFVEVNSQGVLVTRNDDGSFHANGTANTEYVSLVRLGEVNLTAGNRYVITGAVPGMRLTLRDESSGIAYIDDNGDGAYYQPATDMTAYLNIRVEIGGTINATFYPMIRLESNTDPAWEPYTGGLPAPNPAYPQAIVSIENPTVDVCGKNLAHPIGNARTTNGYTITPNSDGTVTVSGSAEAEVDTVIDLALLISSGVYENTELKAGVNYRLTCWKNGELTETPGTKQTLADGTIKWGWTNIENQDRVINKLYRQFVPKIGDTDICGTYATQIEVGTAATEYEPYKPAQSINLTHTLHGIPVSKGGNYTDANGQQWICDEVDFERGVYVQRIGNRVYDGSEDEIWFDELVLDNTVMFRTEISDSVNVGNVVGKDFVCTHFKALNMYNSDVIGTQHTMRQFYFRMLKSSLETEDQAGFRNLLTDSPMTVIYVLATPIEIPLSESELEAFRTAHTNYSTTTVFNDHDARMSIKYNADTLIFLRDNQPKPTDEQVATAVTAYLDANGVQVPSDDHIKALIRAALEEVANGTY